MKRGVTVIEVLTVLAIVAVVISLMVGLFGGAGSHGTPVTDSRYAPAGATDVRDLGNGWYCFYWYGRYHLYHLEGNQMEAFP